MSASSSLGCGRHPVTYYTRPSVKRDSLNERGDEPFGSISVIGKLFVEEVYLALSYFAVNGQ